MRLLPPISAEPLLELPNLNHALAENLHRAGIPSSEALETIGAEAAWDLLAVAELNPNLETLFALEGAIERIEWHSVAPARRFELMKFLAQRAA
jgi:hypothetical protein